MGLIAALLLGGPLLPVADAFSNGERLVFDLSWYGVSGGTAVMEVRTEIDKDRSVYKVSSVTKSNRMISLFYPVNDVVETYMDTTTLYPYRYRSRQQEGTYSSDKEILFDREKNIATFIKHNARGGTHTSEVPPTVQDPLSVVYYFRTLPVEVGKDISLDVYDGNKNWTLIIQVLAKEKVWTPAGTFDTIKIKALIKFEGIFVNKGDVLVWFTDDAFRTPVMMESKIKIGRITAMLIEKQDQVNSNRK